MGRLLCCIVQTMTIDKTLKASWSLLQCNNNDEGTLFRMCSCLSPFADHNMTRSQISVTISTLHNGQEIVCSAMNEFLTTPVESTLKLDVAGWIRTE